MTQHLPLLLPLLIHLKLPCGATASTFDATMAHCACCCGHGRLLLQAWVLAAAGTAPAAVGTGARCRRHGAGPPTVPTTTGTAPPAALQGNRCTTGMAPAAVHYVWAPAALADHYSCDAVVVEGGAHVVMFSEDLLLPLLLQAVGPRLCYCCRCCCCRPSLLQA